MFGKYNGFVSKARVSACMYFLVSWSNISEIGHHLLLCIPAYLIDENQSSEIQSMAMDINYLIDIELTDWSINDQQIVTKIYGQFYRLLLASVNCLQK
jgi:hypothetical protein